MDIKGVKMGKQTNITKAVKIRPDTMDLLNKVAKEQKWSKMTTVDVAVHALYDKLISKKGSE